MNPVSAFFVRNIVAVYFFYGLAFFAMGLALWLATRRTSAFRFAKAIVPLAAFGFLHGLHEWVEMFQKISALTSGDAPTPLEELLRIIILVLSLLLLLSFGMLLLNPQQPSFRQLMVPLAAMTGLWLGSILIVWWMLRPSAQDLLAMADVLARYTLAIPGALLGTWALMKQQHTFREHGMPRFGRDLVWAATALFLYGVIGQVFVRPTVLVPSNVLNSTVFLQWFGVPVQLFRAVLAGAMAIFLTRALNAFDLESQRQLDEANQARVRAQRAQLETERSHSREMEKLNEELRLVAHELAFLLDVANLLVSPLPLESRLQTVMEILVDNIKDGDGGLILLTQNGGDEMRVACALDVDLMGENARYERALALGQQCVNRGVAMCRHLSGATMEFQPESEQGRQKCKSYPSPLTMISLPLRVQQTVIGSLVILRKESTYADSLSQMEFSLITGTAQQMGLSLENARLYDEGQQREKLLGRLLHQVVGAQETERQRIARELHDATGQSLTALSLGLKGVESILRQEKSSATQPVSELGNISTHALGELRQIIADLRPSHLDDLGLVPALRWYLQRYESRRSVDTHLVVTGMNERLPTEYETVLFRITQEALTNIAKHAEADHIAVSLDKSPTEVTLIIEDDGVGFDLVAMQKRSANQRGWGLLGMQERASLLGGKVEVETSPGSGARLTVKIPTVTEIQDVQEDKIIASR